MFRNKIAWTADGNYVLAGRDHGRVSIWKTDSQEFHTGVTIPASLGVNALACSHDSRFVAVAGHSSSLPIIDLASGEVVKEYKGHMSSLEGVAYTPTDLMLASVEMGGEL